MSLEASCNTHTTDLRPVNNRRLRYRPPAATPLPPPAATPLPPPAATPLPPPAATPLPRKSGKNVFSKHLRQVNTQLFRLNGKGVTESETESELSPRVAALHFDRLVLKLVPRELNKLMQLLTYFATDSYYDSVDAIVGFTRENYITRRNIHRDDELERTLLVRGRKKRSVHIPE